jgi:hypothetical protein
MVAVWHPTNPVVMRSLLIVLPIIAAPLAACSGTQSSVTFWFPERNVEPAQEEAAAESTTGELPAHYAEFSAEARAWSYVGERDEDFHDPKDERADADGAAHIFTQWAQKCRVERVATDGGVSTSTVACTPESAVSIAGAYAAFPAGLYRVIDGAVRAEPSNFLVAAAPEPDNHSTGDEHEGAGMTVTYRPDGAWCTSAWAYAGDEFSTEYCFADGIGIVAIDDTFAGGVVVDHRVRGRR